MRLGRPRACPWRGVAQTHARLAREALGSSSTTGRGKQCFDAVLIAGFVPCLSPLLRSLRDDRGGPNAATKDEEGWPAGPHAAPTQRDAGVRREKVGAQDTGQQRTPRETASQRVPNGGIPYERKHCEEMVMLVNCDTSPRMPTHLAGHTGGDDDDVSALEGLLEATVGGKVALDDRGGVDVRDVCGDTGRVDTVGGASQ